MRSLSALLFACVFVLLAVSALGAETHSEVHTESALSTEHSTQQQEQMHTVAAARDDDEEEGGGDEEGGDEQEAKPKVDVAALSKVEAPAETVEDAIRMLKTQRENVRTLEAKIAAQQKDYDVLIGKPDKQKQGIPVASGSDYWVKKLDKLKSSDGYVQKPVADQLKKRDARCVICQYVVQQTIGILQGRPMTVGGATAGGKRAAASWLEAPKPESFLEVDAQIQAEVEEAVQAEAMAEAEAEAQAEAQVEAESGAEMETEEGSEALMERYARRVRRRPYATPNLRNVAPVSYPRQLNDWGYEAPTRNRRSDILDSRPRTARFTQNVEALKAKWDQTRETYKKLYTGVYDSFEKLCSHRMPLAYMPYCTQMLKDYRYIAQGIQFGDRAQTICMNGNWCNRKSYIRQAVHAYFVRAHGDA